MTRTLFTTAAVGALATALAAPAANAETVISTAVTTPVATGTANDSIRISSTGSVKPTSGAAVTINSNHGVKNEGLIAIQGANNATGILANPNVTATINNSGTITIDENYTATDADNDGDLDGPFAQGSGRFGIRVLPGGTFTGTVTNSGTINVEGNQSAGIAIDGALAGSITNSGKITVVGNDSVGLRAGNVSGNVTVVNGAITARGQNAVGVQLNGDIGGALVLQGDITTSGYRSTTAPADPSKLDADDLLQGGPAVAVGGDVAGGILLDVRPTDSNPNNADEDGDGVPDAQEGNSSIVSFGAAPALQIGSTSQGVAIGAVASSTDGHGLVVRGSVLGSGVYEGVNGTAISVGGTGHTVSIAGGATIAGTVSARAAGANATAIYIGAGASVPTINVTGQVAAEGGGTATTGAQGILVDTGATVNSIRNSGSISAGRSGADGTATAILDKAGSVDLIENSGVIGVVGSALGDQGIAIDLRANSGGATVRQIAAAAGKPAPHIQGNILFGSGNDQLELLAGSAFGKVDFGGGADTLTLGGSSLFRGTLANSAGLSVNVGAGATLDAKNLGAVNLAALTTGAGSTLGVTIGEAGHTLYNVAGSATFGAGTNIAVSLDSVGDAEGVYTIIDAGTLSGAGNLSSSVVTLPYLFNSTLAGSDATGEVTLTLTQKTAGELALNDSESAILGAALKAADADQPIAAVFLGIQNSKSLKSALQQLMPEHAGGAFETATKGSRLTANILAGPRLSSSPGGRGLWMQQVAWGSSKSIGSTSSYDLTGWGAAAGVEQSLGGFGNIGVTAAYLSGRDTKNDNELTSSQYEAGAYWRGAWGPFRAFARGTAGLINFDGTRTFSDEVDGEVVSRDAEGDWKGRLYSAVAGVSYEVRAGRITLRPSASIEHFKLKEKGYTESGGGDAFNLTVGKRDSDETAAVGTLAVGYDLWGSPGAESWMRVELEGGRRQILSGSLGATTASFSGGEPFKLTPEERTSGWRAGLRVAGGGPGLSIAAEVGGEEQQGAASIGGRVGVGFGF